MKIRIGAQLHPQHCTFDALARAARRVDELGADTLWTWDHFYPLYGSKGAPMSEDLPPGADPALQGGHFEGWTLLSAFAAITSTVHVGLLVSCNSYRNPDLVADMARTIDHISAGRAILGIGSGWYEKDYTEYGYEFGTPVGRLKDLEKSLPRIKARMGQLNPPPVRGSIPIMIGGGGEKFTLRLVAEHADLWNGFGDLDAFRHKNGVLDDWCKKVGRDPGSIDRSVLLLYPHHVEQADAYLEAGATHLIFGLGPPFDLSPLEKLLEWREARACAR